MEESQYLWYESSSSNESFSTVAGQYRVAAVRSRERTGRAMCTGGGKNRRAAGRASRDIDLFFWKPHLMCGSKRSTSNNPGFLREKRLVHSSEAWDDEFEEIKAEAVSKPQRKK